MHANFSLPSFSSILSYYLIFLTLKENALMNASKARSSIPEAATLLKETPAELFSCEFCDIFKNVFFTEHLRATNSVKSHTIFFFYKE